MGNEMQIKIKIELRVITPAEAADMLEHNRSNRKIREPHVKKLMGAMLRGEWEQDGAPIRFTTDGCLIDGQHRLTALVKSGLAQVMSVATGLDKTTADSIDTGRGRTLGDSLCAHGIKNYNAVKAVATMVFYQKDSAVPVRTGSTISPTATQILKLLDEEPLIQEAVSKIVGPYRKFCKKFMKSGVGGFLLYSALKDDREQAADFFGKLESGIGLDATCPIYVLRERLIKEETAVKKDHRPREKIAVAVKAYNLYKEGKEVSMIRVGGAAKGDKIGDVYLIR